MKKLLIILTAAALVFPIAGCAKVKLGHGNGHHNSRHPLGGPPGQMRHGGHGPSTEVEIELPAAEIEINTGRGRHRGRRH